MEKKEVTLKLVIVSHGALTEEEVIEEILRMEISYNSKEKHRIHILDIIRN